MAKSPFDFINNISSSRTSIWDDTSDTEYNSFMVNRGLSQYPDTILYSQLINENGQYLSNKQQYDFYRLAINNKKKRFAKWHKAKKRDDISELAEFYGISVRRLEQYLELMSDSELTEVADMMYKGGKEK